MQSFRQSFRTDAVVVGGGVVGLAIARSLAASGLETIVLERGDDVGREITARNSGVMHAGVYYRPGSLKAQLCAPGRAMLQQYCTEAGVDFLKCGKLIVAANEDEAATLPALRQRALANGVRDIRLICSDEAQALEPQISCAAALHCADTGVVDVHGLMLALLHDLRAAGGEVALRTEARAITPDGGRLLVETAGDDAGATLSARLVVNAAGHGAPALARATAGLPHGALPRQWFAKGNYFALNGRNPFSRLIYPAGAPASGDAPGLGVHATIDLDGQLRFGPDVEWTDRPDDHAVDPARQDLFETAIRRWWPALPQGALTPAWAGVRPKLHGPETPAADFRIDGPAAHGVAGLVNLFGIESPGLTCALAIARRLQEALASG